MKFEIRWKGPEDGKDHARIVKGMVEITRVIDPRTSEVRIFEGGLDGLAEDDDVIGLELRPRRPLVSLCKQRKLLGSDVDFDRLGPIQKPSSRLRDDNQATVDQDVQPKSLKFADLSDTPRMAASENESGTART